MSDLRNTDNIEFSTLIATTALTTALTTTPVIYIGGANQIIYHIRYTKGSSYSVKMAFDFAVTKSFWSQETKYAVASNITTHQPNVRQLVGTNAMPVRIAVPVADRWARIRHQAVSTGGSAKLYIKFGRSYI